MTTTTNRPQARTVPLKGTSKKTAAHLDFASLAALQYAQHWAANRAHRKAPLSLILRRALAVYAAHLEAISKAEPTAPGRIGEPLAPQTLHEARMLEAAGGGRGALCPASGLLTEDEAQALAGNRLAALRGLPAGDPWPAFDAVLFGAEVVARSRAEYLALEERVETILEDIARTPHGRLKGLRREVKA